MLPGKPLNRPRTPEKTPVHDQAGGKQNRLEESAQFFQPDL
jgi:hypothetical protein